jgi:transcriptional regulator with XRE-family HTH domain
MEQKDKYTLRELYEELNISLAELGRRAGISEVTVAKIRDGASARRSTINSLLRTFSKIYDINLSQNNVSGIIINDKIARQELSAKGYTSFDVQDEKLPISISEGDNTSPSKKRTYTRFEGIPTDLPRGTIKAIDFMEKYALPESSFSRWVKEGLKGERIETETRQKASGMGVQHYLTPAQQEKALDLLKRHGKLKTQEMA